jgi:hypothetical protein
MFVPLAFHKESIVTRGLILHIDAADRTSHSPTSIKWNDLSGNNNNGVLTNGPTFNSGNGGSIIFDGTDDYTIISNSNLPTLYSLSALSVCGFFKVDNTSGQHRQIYSWGNNNGIRFRVDSGGNSVRLFDRGGINPITHSFTINDDTWYFFCTIADNSGLTVFINTDKSTGGTTFSPTHTGNTVYIGSRNDGTSELMDGSIACIFMYNRTLSDNEVTQNYNALKSRFDIL